MTETKTTFLLSVLSLVIIGIGSFASITITRKKFLEDFNHMNGYYKQTLFLTGQSKRPEAKEQYDLLVSAYADFTQKYATYRPYAIKHDTQFDTDLLAVESIVSSVKAGVYSGDLPQTHKDLEMVRPIFQEMFKRNDFSLLSMALVDFHDLMEEIIAAADAKDAQKLLAAYPKVDAALQAVEKEDSSEEIQVIRKNLNTIKTSAEAGAIEVLSAQAAELKTSFVKVYLK